MNSFSAGWWVSTMVGFSRTSVLVKVIAELRVAVGRVGAGGGAILLPKQFAGNPNTLEFAQKIGQSLAETRKARVCTGRVSGVQAALELGIVEAEQLLNGQRTGPDPVQISFNRIFADRQASGDKLDGLTLLVLSQELFD